MNPIGLVGIGASMLVLYLLFAGRWDSFIDELTGHKTTKKGKH